MSDKRLKRINCPYCGLRVTVGPAGRIYKHLVTVGGAICVGHGVKVQDQKKLDESGYHVGKEGKE